MSLKKWVASPSQTWSRSALTLSNWRTVTARRVHKFNLVSYEKKKKLEEVRYDLLSFSHKYYPLVPFQVLNPSRVAPAWKEGVATSPQSSGQPPSFPSDLALGTMAHTRTPAQRLSCPAQAIPVGGASIPGGILVPLPPRRSAKENLSQDLRPRLLQF